MVPHLLLRPYGACELNCSLCYLSFLDLFGISFSSFYTQLLSTYLEAPLHVEQPPHQQGWDLEQGTALYIQARKPYMNSILAKRKRRWGKDRKLDGPKKSTTTSLQALCVTAVVFVADFGIMMRNDWENKNKVSLGVHIDSIWIVHIYLTNKHIKISTSNQRGKHAHINHPGILIASQRQYEIAWRLFN